MPAAARPGDQEEAERAAALYCERHGATPEPERPPQSSVDAATIQLTLSAMEALDPDEAPARLTLNRPRLRADA